MRALITGGAGFIGLHVARALAARGCAVTLVDKAGSADGGGELAAFVASGPHTFIECDLRQARPLDDLEGEYAYVFHFAAILGVAAVRKDPTAVLRDNVEMQLRVLDFAARQPSLQRFVFTSTSEVYAGTLQQSSLRFPTPEDTSLALPDLSEPRTSYMLSKIYGEALMQHAGLPFVIVRPHNIYGPRMGTRHVIPQLMQRIAATPGGADLPVYSADHRRTFCYIQDAAEMFVAIVQTPATAGITLNIGTEQPEVTMRELAQRICRVMGREVRIVDGPVTAGSPSRRQPDISRIVSMTGILPAVDLDEGLRRTYAWYQQHVLWEGSLAI